jgi:hypothetical protein
MRNQIWCGLVVAGIAVGTGRAQTKIAAIDLQPHGQMTKAELAVQYPLPDPPPDEKGFLTSGPVGGIAWSGVCAVAVDSQGKVYVDLPLWGDKYAPKSSLRGGDGNKLRVLKIDSTGKIENTMDFPTVSLNRLDLRVASDGTLLVLAGDKWMRVGADGKPDATLDVPNEEKPYEVWDVFVSASGRTMRLRENRNHALFVNADTLQIIKDCRTANDYNDEGTLTDDLELPTENVTKEPPYKQGVMKQLFCGRQERVSVFGEVTFQPVLVDDEHFVAIGPGQLELRKLTGETLWTAEPPTGLAFDTYEGHEPLSQNGKRIAVRLYGSAGYKGPTNDSPEAIRNGTWRGRIETIKIEDSIGVWDIETGRMVSQIVMPGHTEFRHYDPEAYLALSPDGKTLAIVEDTTATIWRLP